MKLIDDSDRRANTPEYGVSEISNSIKNILANKFGRVRIRGELGRVFVARSGHVYYDLKDKNSVLSTVTFKGQMSGLSISPEEGLEVVATGKLTTFGTQSKYQLVVDELRVSGVGSLMAMLEKRKEMLNKEGLFDQDKKKKIPYIPELIGVITSPQGAVISDILHRLRDRFPRKVLIWPVTVQGDSCAKQVSQAIIGFNSLPSDGELRRPDLLIVARGGGSIEDLWGFNEEIVVRAAANSEIPIISAVGHETDTTLLDYVSDIRAPTPSAAAEMAVPVRRDLIFGLNSLGIRLNTTIVRILEIREKRIRDLFRVISRPDDFVIAVSEKLLNLTDKLPKALKISVQSK
ncbi:MAG: exodeoxyribonuclease VII large subunit, partial [Proteobacteria bacterium]|nr:exodeoxyribonuclease VII large subunit [Pseudomonadota bacterium]